MYHLDNPGDAARLNAFKGRLVLFLVTYGHLQMKEIIVDRLLQRGYLPGWPTRQSCRLVARMNSIVTPLSSFGVAQSVPP
jgi:hypothetical protein